MHGEPSPSRLSEVVHSGFLVEVGTTRSRLAIGPLDIRVRLPSEQDRRGVEYRLTSESADQVTGILRLGAGVRSAR